MKRDKKSGTRILLADFFENAPIGMHWISAGGRILHANRAQLELLGYKRGEYVGRNVAQFYAEAKLARKTLRELARDHVVHNLEAWLKCKDGSFKEVLIDANVFWDTGKFVHACCFMRDITERRAREKQVLEISEREQQRIGQDLHDHLCQLLTGIRLRTILLEKKLKEKNLAEHKDALVLAEFLTQAIEQAHSVARGLHPVEFEEHGLMYALHELVNHLEAVFASQCECRIRKPVLIQNSTVAIHLYRIAQEGMTNSIKHGQAKNVVVQLVERKGQIVLSVVDDGVGFPSKMVDWPPHKGLGLPLMKYRARMIGGQLSIARRRGGGTILACSVPVTVAQRPESDHAS